MTPRLPIPGRSTSSDPYVSSTPPRGRALALAALICTLIAAALSSHPERNSALPPTVGAVLAPAAPGHATADRTRAEEQRVRRIAAVVATRYRVASDATRQFVEIAYREARRNHLDPLLVLAVIAVESRFDPRAESDSGAMGLMQVIPRYHVRNAQDATRSAMLDPGRNIGLGTRVLRQYVKAGGTEAAGLQLYNGASDDVTNAYSNKVMAEKRRLIESLRDPKTGEPA